MAHKINDQQGNIYYIKGSSLSEAHPPTSLLNNQAIKHLATILAQSLNIQLHDQHLAYLLGYANCESNLEAITAWLAEQAIQEPNHIEFQDLYNKLLFRLVDVSNGFSSI